MSALLEVRGLRKRFRSGDAGWLDVLTGVHLGLARGEVVAVVGASGSGKSTLLHMLGALDRPSGGDIVLDGTSYGELAPAGLAALRNRRIGFVFQFHFLLPEFTALENVEIPMITLGERSREEARKRAESLLTRVGLSHRLNSYPSRLSGGEMQRVAIARALANAPDLVLCDEPTGNLDSNNSAQVYDLLREINREEGLTVIVVTHDATFAEKADRIVTITDGMVTEDRARARA